MLATFHVRLTQELSLQYAPQLVPASMAGDIEHAVMI
jgi:hypothetical protein